MLSSKILLGLGESYKLLYTKNLLKKSIQEVLGILGRASDVDRVYIFKNHMLPDESLGMSQVFEWTKEGISAQLEFEPLQNLFWSLFPELLEKLESNVPINDYVKNSTNQFFYETMHEQGIISYLFVPIFTGEKFWGYIGFDNCTRIEKFKEEQVAALHAFAGNFGSEIMIRKQRKLLKRKRMKFWEFIQSLDNILFKLNAKGEFVFLNQAWENYTGYKIGNCLGKSLLSFIEPQDFSNLESAFTRTKMEGYTSVQKELRMRLANGKYRWFLIRFKADFSNHGDFRGFKGFLMDTHEKVGSKQKIQKLTEFFQLINEIQLGYFESDDMALPLENLLKSLLRITDSKFGFIAEILYDEQGQPYLKTHAISNISWSKETEAFYQDHYYSGMEFRNLDTLFGEVVKTEEVLIANDVGNDKRAKGTPAGHPPLKRFLGIPVKKTMN